MRTVRVRALRAGVTLTRIRDRPPPTRQRRDVLRMRWHGLSVRQIADAQGLTPAAVRALLEGP